MMNEKRDGAPWRWLCLVLLVVAAGEAEAGAEAVEDAAGPWTAAPEPTLTDEEFPLPRHDPRPLMQALIERTQPTEATPFTFVVLSDYHSREENAGIFAVADELEPDFILTLGDMTDSASLEHWQQLEQAGGDLFRKYPTWSVMGNHELGGPQRALGGPRFSAYWAQPHDDIFSFTYANTTFIGLPWSGADEAAAKKLERKLADAQGTRIFLFCHYLPWSRGIHPRQEHGHLIEKYNVFAVLDAHTHTYLRRERNGTHHIKVGINGPLGLRRREPDSDERFLVVFTVEGPHVSMRLLNAEGEEWDRATLAGPEQDEAADAEAAPAPGEAAAAP